MAIKRGLKSLKLLVVGEAAMTNPQQPGQRAVLAQKCMTEQLDALMVEHPRGGELELKNGDVVVLTGVLDTRTSIAPRSGRTVVTYWMGDVLGAKVEGNIFDNPKLAEEFAAERTVVSQTFVIGQAPAAAQSGDLAN